MESSTQLGLGRSSPKQAQINRLLKNLCQLVGTETLHAALKAIATEERAEITEIAESATVEVPDSVNQQVVVIN